MTHRVRILETLRSGPASMADLAQRLGISLTKVNKHMLILRSKNLVVAGSTEKRAKTGRPTTLWEIPIEKSK